MKLVPQLSIENVFKLNKKLIWDYPVSAYNLYDIISEATYF